MAPSPIAPPNSAAQSQAAAEILYGPALPKQIAAEFSATADYFDHTPFGRGRVL